MAEFFDKIVIGGGFYGTYLSTFLKTKNNRILLLEKGADLLQRASYTNQARVHNGYHYPRNYLTAFRSALNFPKFVIDFAPAIDHSFEKLYAIARNNSKVNSEQFYSFCKKINAPIAQADQKTTALFSPQLIEKVYVVKEFAFNATELKKIVQNKIEITGVETRLNTQVASITHHNNEVIVNLEDGTEIHTNAVYLAAYSSINHILSQSHLPILPMKHEITEMALIEPPDELRKKAVTVMDGPFFSTMPFPARGDLYSLSHVRYTPHESWIDTNVVNDPDTILHNKTRKSHFMYMIKDAQKYLPCLSKAVYKESLYEIKTVLQSTESNDGRPILYRRDYGMPNLSVIMGGKIDNIYDIVDAMKTLSETA